MLWSYGFFNIKNNVQNDSSEAYSDVGQLSALLPTVLFLS